MRSFLSLLLGLLMAFSIADRAHAAIPKPGTDVSLPITRAVSIAPHRAAYKLALGSVKNGANISGISGHMSFEWRDVCDGWAVQQHMTLHFSYAEGSESSLTSTELTWESKDGQSYTFNVHRITDGNVEDYRGKAEASGADGVALYEAPSSKKMLLPAGTVFPSAHTVQIIQHALSGERFFTRTVFDGSDSDGYGDVSVFIGAQKPDLREPVLDAGLKGNKLLDVEAWPIRMAFFKPGQDALEPDYEMGMTLLTNGVARDLDIDYSDFSIAGTLESVEPLAVPHC